MDTPLNPMMNALADAPLTPEQHKAWQDMCAELVVAHVRIQELENRIKILNRQPNHEGSEQTVLNRPDFNREVARMLAIDERYETISSVLYFDIENLDAIKERHGAELVDAAVRCVCDTLLTHVRRSDLLGRLAPDEFGMLLPRCDNAAAWKKGKQLAASIYEALTTSWGPTLKPSISYGAYTFREKENVATGLKKAAESLTHLKPRGA